MFGRRSKGLTTGEEAPVVNLRAKAIACLARREYSRAELSAKLGQWSSDKPAIDALLDTLVAENYLSDRRAAQSVVRARSARHGTMRVVGELRAKGISGELAGDMLRELKDTESARALALWERKFGEPAPDAQERARQMRFLQARGFALDVIRAVVPGTSSSARPRD